MYSHVDSLNSLCGGWRSDLLHNKLEQKGNHRRQALHHSLFIYHTLSQSNVQYTIKLMLTKYIFQGSALRKNFMASTLDLSLTRYYSWFMLCT